MKFSIIALAVCTGRSWQAVYERTATENTREYQDYAYRPALRACDRSPPLDKAKCIADAREAERSNARDEYDLEAQRVTALWTGIMGMAAVTGMMLSALGVWLVFTTFRETKRSADAAHRNILLLIDSERAVLRPCDTAGMGDARSPRRIGKKKATVTFHKYGKSQGTINEVEYSTTASNRWPKIVERDDVVALLIARDLEGHGRSIVGLRGGSWARS